MILEAKKMEKKIPKKIILLVILISVISVSLCGCWNYRDLEKMLLVSGFAIDKNEAGDKYLLTIEVIDYEMSGVQAKQSAKQIQSEGKTIFEAIRNVINIIGRRLYWAHANMVIISEDIAKEGINPTLDFIARDAELRSEMYVLISKEKTARDVLLQQMLISQTSSDNIENMLVEQKDIGDAPDVHVYDFMENLHLAGSIIPAVQLMENMGIKTATLAGTAVFKGDKLVGYLNLTDSKFLIFTRNEIKKGLITVNENPENKVDNITLEIFKSKTKIKPSYTNNRLTMNIDISTEVSIAEMATSIDFSDKKNIGKLKKDAEDKVKSSVESIVKKVQQEYGIDIFKFDKIIKAEEPKLWKQIEPDWDNVFKELNCNVNVNIKIRNCGFSSKAIKEGA